jgi:hypothetical protein
VFIESWVVHLGKRMGLTMGAMRLGSEDGKTCYTVNVDALDSCKAYADFVCYDSQCEHGKAAVGSSTL